MQAGFPATLRLVEAVHILIVTRTVVVLHRVLRGRVLLGGLRGPRRAPARLHLRDPLRSACSGWAVVSGQRLATKLRSVEETVSPKNDATTHS